MLQRTIGIVLKTVRYNDTSIIVDIYTDLNGRTSYLVSLPNSGKASLRRVMFQPLFILEYESDYRPRLNLQRLRDVRILYPFASLPYDLRKTAVALFLAEFLTHALQEEAENAPLFSYLINSIRWLDECRGTIANFHLVFLMHLSRFLGLYPNLNDFQEGDYFDLRAACFVPQQPLHSDFVPPTEAARLGKLMRMNYETMHLFAMSRTERNRCVEIILEFYRLHIPNFPELKSVKVLRELFS